MTDERIDKERARAEKEYRAQWIRDAARDLLIAHKNGRCAETMFTGDAYRLAIDLWDRYVKERE